MKNLITDSPTYRREFQDFLNTCPDLTQIVEYTEKFRIIPESPEELYDTCDLVSWAEKHEYVSKKRLEELLEAQKEAFENEKDTFVDDVDELLEDICWASISEDDIVAQANNLQEKLKEFSGRVNFRDLWE